MLSERARRYLASLRRIKAVPTPEVERALREQGLPCFSAWLDFHERYAGYVEPLGAEVAIWGIVHENSHWIKPGRAAVEKSHGEEAEWLVACAEVHGSYT
jgi:hypothetical protein